MANLFFYLLTISIWGTTWLGLRYQVDSGVPFIWSIAYRFVFAGILLLVYCYLSNRQCRFSCKHHLLLAAQGISMFGINFVFLYWATSYMISGLAALVFATIILMNIFNSRLFFDHTIAKKVLLGALFGLTGLCFVFWNQIEQTTLLHGNNTQLLLGILLALIGAYIASLSNMLAVYTQRLSIPILQSNAFAMLYGGSTTAVIACLSQAPFTFSLQLHYLGSLIYLSLFGSILAFYLYIELLRKIGASKAAYILVITPLIALLVSTLFEGLTWSTSALIGISFIVLGNVLVLS